jgi:hypothetical protein
MESPEPKPRLRPRISLLSLLLLTALIACAIVIAIQMREIGPMRHELTRLRAETGQLTIVDPKKIYVTAMETLEDDTWKWRVYLPTGTDYELGEIFGRVPSRPLFTVLEKRVQPSGFNCSSPIDSGEYIITVALRPYEVEGSLQGNWGFIVECRHVSSRTKAAAGAAEVTTGGRCGRQGMDWMDDQRARSFATEGDAQIKGVQREFDAAHGLNLLTLLRSEVTENASGWSTKAPDPTKENDGAAVWIVPRKK